MKSAQVHEIINRDRWATAEGTHEDKPLLIRFRHESRAISDFEGYSQLLLVTWTYESNETGMPSEEQLREMEDFENDLIASLEHDQHGVLTAVITNNGTRQWVIYADDMQECEDRINAMPQNGELFPIDLVSDEDEEWSYLRENILAGCVEM